MKKNLLIAALLSTAVGASFAQTAVPPTTPSQTVPAPAAVPAPATATPSKATAAPHDKKHAKKAAKKAHKAKAPSHT